MSNPLYRIIHASMNAPLDGDGNKRSMLSVATSSGLAYSIVHGVCNSTSSRVADNVIAVLRVVAPDVVRDLEEAATALEREADQLNKGA